jgi:hypothetical protein
MATPSVKSHKTLPI